MRRRSSAYRTLTASWRIQGFNVGDFPDAWRMAMADVIYLVVGVGVLLIFAGYALLLRRA